LKVALIAAVVLLSAMGATELPCTVGDSDKGCNVRLKGLKTLSDPQPQARQPAPKEHDAHGDQCTAATTPNTEDALHRVRPAGLARKCPDHGIQDRRRQRHLVLFDGGAYLIAEMPAATCVPKKARDRRGRSRSARSSRSVAGSRQHWQPLGAVAAISGVGFFDIPHTQKTHAMNFAELHPVIWPVADLGLQSLTMDGELDVTAGWTFLTCRRWQTCGLNVLKGSSERSRSGC
jgi:hypothetical protein